MPGDRLFVAAVPPPEALEPLAAELAAQPLEPWRPVAPGLWHVTVAFYAAVPPTALERLEPRLARAAARQPVLRLRLAGLGVFPRRVRRARVLWAGLEGDLAPLRRLAASARAAARRCGIAVADEEFRPHLTLARARAPAGADAGPLLAALAGYRGDPFAVAEVVLLRSHLGARVRHERLAGYPLGGLSAPAAPPATA